MSLVPQSPELAVVYPARPNRVVLKDDPYHQDSEDMVEFRLTYEGQLLGSSRTDTRAQHKHEIRRVFHSQLKRLWQVSPYLQGLTDPPIELLEINLQGIARRPRVHALAERFSRCGYNFVPLVTGDLGITFVGLEILFLRTDPPGNVIQSGDIDNRLKTLFDAFRLPSDKNELGGYDAPGDGETPFYCLLEDDKMISKVSVETDVLLESVGPQIGPHDVRLLIKVSLQPRMPRIDMRYLSTILAFPHGDAKTK